MILLYQNTGTTVALTLTENSGTTSGFTLSLEDKTSTQIYSGITLNDTSLYTQRYNLYTITLTGNSSAIDYSNTIIYLPNKYYNYYVYNNLNEIAEYGLCYVSGSTSQEYVKIYNNDIPDYTTY